MILSVSADRVALIIGTANQGWMQVRHSPNDEKGCLNALCFQRFQDARRMRRNGAVIERQHHLMVMQRKSLTILHRADPRIFGWAYGDDAASSKCVQVPGAVSGSGGAPSPQQ